MKKLLSSLFTVSIILIFSSCAVPFKVQAPVHAVKQTRNQAILQAIQTTGKDGDWLVVRNYHQTDNMVSALRNAPLAMPQF